MIGAEQIKQARKRLTESQAEFGKRFGVDQSTIHRWETSGPPINGPAPKLLAQLLVQLESEAAE